MGSFIVRLPSKEGHVFRSKERTPVLLLMEVLRPSLAAAAEDVDQEEEQEEENKMDLAVNSGLPSSPSFDVESPSFQMSKPEQQIDDNNTHPDASPKKLKKQSSERKITNTPKTRALKRLDSKTEEELVSETKARANTEMEEMVAEAVKNQLTLHDSTTVNTTTN